MPGGELRGAAECLSVARAWHSMGLLKGNWVVVEKGGCGVELIPEVVMWHTNRFRVPCAH